MDAFFELSPPREKITSEALEDVYQLLKRLQADLREVQALTTEWLYVCEGLKKMERMMQQLVTPDLPSVKKRRITPQTVAETSPHSASASDTVPTAETDSVPPRS